MENIKLTFVDEDEDTHAHCFIDGNKDDGFLIQCFDGYKKSNDFTRRICAAWNACEGLETELLEGLPLNFKAHALQCAALREENAALRAALREVLSTGLNGGNNVRLSMIAASRNPLSNEDLERAEKSEIATTNAWALLAKNSAA